MNNNKGFSLLEILAVILISTTVLVPLLFSLVGNANINRREITKEAASNIVAVTINGFNTMRFNDLVGAIDDVETAAYAEFNKASGCDQLPLGHTPKSTADICALVFEASAANVSFEADEFRVFLVPYSIPQADYDILTDPLNDTIPPEVQALIAETILINETPSSTQPLRIFVWIQYGPRARDILVEQGLIVRD